MSDGNTNCNQIAGAQGLLAVLGNEVVKKNGIEQHKRSMSGVG